MAFVYMAVCDDEYELPLAVSGTARELAKMLGVNEQTIYKSRWRQNHGSDGKYKKGVKYLRVEIEEEDENGCESNTNSLP